MNPTCVSHLCMLSGLVDYNGTVFNLFKKLEEKDLYNKLDQSRQNLIKVEMVAQDYFSICWI